MNNRLMMTLLLVIGMFYLFYTHVHKIPPPQPPPILNIPASDAASPVLPEIGLSKIRQSAADSDPSVRWAAIELLYSLHDPHAAKILEETMAADTEPSVRKNALNLLRQNPKTTNAKVLTIALRDPEKEVRIAALMALGEMGDPRVIPQVTQLLNDVESDVRLQALHTLNHIQEQKRTEYQKLTEELKREYERALQKDGGGPAAR